MLPGIREKVEIIIYRRNVYNKVEVCICINHGSWQFPGGGLDGESIDDAAAKECLEEVGIEITNIEDTDTTHYLPISSLPDSKYIKAGRHRYKGFFTHLVKAEFSRLNSSLYNVEGDAMKFEWLDVESARKLLRANKFKEFAEWRYEALGKIKF